MSKKWLEWKADESNSSQEFQNRLSQIESLWSFPLPQRITSQRWWSDGAGRVHRLGSVSAFMTICAVRSAVWRRKRSFRGVVRGLQHALTRWLEIAQLRMSGTQLVGVSLPCHLRSDCDVVGQRAIVLRHNAWCPLCIIRSVVTCPDMVTSWERAWSSERLLGGLVELLALDDLSRVRSDEIQSRSEWSLEK